MSLKFRRVLILLLILFDFDVIHCYTTFISTMFSKLKFGLTVSFGLFLPVKPRMPDAA